MNPRAAVDDVQHQDALLLDRPRGVGPARLPQHAEDAGPPAQAVEGAEQGNGDLIPVIGRTVRHCSNSQKTQHFNDVADLLL